MVSENNCKPFLRWAGGKQWIAAKLARIAPDNGGNYYEPFLGGGSVFFSCNPKRAVIGDINSDLIETYRVVRDHPLNIISIMSQWNNDKKTYYEVRSARYTDKLRRAARFIYLNKTCWNGLYRVNRQGEFNVPFGNNNRTVFDAEDLIKASKILRRAKIVCGDFENVLSKAEPGDFIYLDPPYTVLHSQNGFRQYNEKLFSWEDQARLAGIARDLKSRGCLVVISNANNNEIVRLYSDFLYQKISRHSILAANPKFRRKTDEALFVSSKHLLLND